MTNLKFLQNKETNENLNSQDEKSKESKLITELWSILKSDEDNIAPEDLFLFLLCVLNLYEFYLISKSHSKTTNLDDHTKETFNFNLDRVVSVEKINAEINNRICSPKKYGGKDVEKNFVVNFNHAKAINRDFNIFYVNRSNQLLNENKQKKALSLTNTQQNFKPSIDLKSEKLSNEYRKKIISDIPENYDTSKKSYVDILMLKKKMNQNKNMKQLEENIKKELDLCTFSPQINKNIKIKNYDVTNRIDFLYRQGTAKIIKSPSSRSKEEIEINKNSKEYTFRPNIPERIEVTGPEGNISNSKEIIKMMERLKNGREVINLIKH